LKCVDMFKNSFSYVFMGFEKSDLGVFFKWIHAKSHKQSLHIIPPKNDLTIFACAKLNCSRWISPLAQQTTDCRLWWG
jgi:hypothetical protein